MSTTIATSAIRSNANAPAANSNRKKVFLLSKLMSIENFIRDALYKPNDYIAYHVGRELAELHPGKSVLEGRSGYFDLDAFVRAEKCSVVEERSVFQHVTTEWMGIGEKPREQIE